MQFFFPYPSDVAILRAVPRFPPPPGVSWDVKRMRGTAFSANLPPPGRFLVRQECQRSGYRSNPVRLPLGAAPSKDDLEAFELELGLAAAMRESPADWAAVA